MSESGTSCETWCQPLIGREQSLPVCHRARTLQLRAQGTPLRTDITIDEIRDWLYRIGLTVRTLLSVAKSLDPQLEQYLCRAEGIQASDESEMATIEQVGKLVYCYIRITDHPCVEEIIGCFLSTLNERSVLRASYDQSPDCNEGILRQFEELITHVLTYDSDANLYDDPPSEVDVLATGPGSPNDFSNCHTHHLRPLIDSVTGPHLRNIARHSNNLPLDIPLVHQNDLSDFDANKGNNTHISATRDCTNFSYSSPPIIALNRYVEWAISPGMSVPSITADGSNAKTDESNVQKDIDHYCSGHSGQSDQSVDTQLLSVQTPPQFDSDGQVHVDSIHADAEVSLRQSFASGCDFSGDIDDCQSADRELLSIDSPSHADLDDHVDSLHSFSNAVAVSIDSIQSVAVQLQPINSPSHFDFGDSVE